MDASLLHRSWVSALPQGPKTHVKTALTRSIPSGLAERAKVTGPQQNGKIPVKVELKR